MSERVVCLGLSHRTAPVAVRERASLSTTATQAVLAELLADSAVDEALVLSTCNRTEIYGTGADVEAVRAALFRVVLTHTPLPPVELTRAAYLVRGAAALRHLMRVAASLDSAVLGESEIQGQVKQALRLAGAVGALGPLLEPAGRAALIAGSRSRRQTTICCGAVSMASAAVELARQELGGLLGRTAVVVGAGSMADGVAHALRGRGLSGLAIAGRTPAHAEALAKRVGARHIPYPLTVEDLRAADVVISATAAPGHVITRDAVERATAPRGDSVLVIVDVAVPRDVEPSVRDLPAVVLRDVDDLARTVDGNLARRRSAALMAERIVEEELRRLLERLPSDRGDSLPAAA